MPGISASTKLGKAFAAITKQEFTSFVFKADEAARLVAQSEEVCSGQAVPRTGGIRCGRH
jgi:hypothetical protein